MALSHLANHSTWDVLHGTGIVDDEADARTDNLRIKMAALALREKDFSADQRADLTAIRTEAELDREMDRAGVQPYDLEQVQEQARKGRDDGVALPDQADIAVQFGFIDKEVVDEVRTTQAAARQAMDIMKARQDWVAGGAIGPIRALDTDAGGSAGAEALASSNRLARQFIREANQKGAGEETAPRAFFYHGEGPHNDSFNAGFSRAMDDLEGVTAAVLVRGMDSLFRKTGKQLDDHPVYGLGHDPAAPEAPHYELQGPPGLSRIEGIEVRYPEAADRSPGTAASISTVAGMPADVTQVGDFSKRWLGNAHAGEVERLSGAMTKVLERDMQAGLALKAQAEDAPVGSRPLTRPKTNAPRM